MSHPFFRSIGLFIALFLGQSSTDAMLAYPETFTDGDFTANWCLDGSTLHMQLISTGTGWISLGFTDTVGMGASMINTDIALFNDSGFQDSWSTALSPPPSDVSLGGTSDISVDSFTDNGSSTIVEFNRPLTTSDSSFDLDLASPRFLVWAFHATEDDYTAAFPTGWHGANRGFGPSTDFSLAGACTAVPEPSAFLFLLLVGFALVGFKSLQNVLQCRQSLASWFDATSR